MKIEMAWVTGGVGCEDFLAGLCGEGWRPGVAAQRMPALTKSRPSRCQVLSHQGGTTGVAEDDPFAWRDRLPFVRASLPSSSPRGSLLLLALLFAFVSWPLAIVPAILWSELRGSFGTLREFHRPPGLVVSPADGRVWGRRVQASLSAHGLACDHFSVDLQRACQSCPVDARVISCRMAWQVRERVAVEASARTSSWRSV